MPAKYSHIKKRSAAGLLNTKSSTNGHIHTVKPVLRPSPHTDRSLLSLPLSLSTAAVSQLERSIARILLLRYQHDIARLFSTRIHALALIHLPTLVLRCLTLAGPSWMVFNADSDTIKDFFRAVISMDLRQAGERVATKSVLWSYTALRHFAISNDVHICHTRGLHSARLLPFYSALKAHLDTLEAMPNPTFGKPPQLGPLTDGLDALEEACELKYASAKKAKAKGKSTRVWPSDWRPKVHLGYERAAQTLWSVAREFDVRGYGLVLREKLTTKWCDCGCSTDHLGEVCERTVREEEEESGVRHGKQREWDGRGSGVSGWGTEDEEDLWEIDLDFGALDPDDPHDPDVDMTIAELMEWRYLRAEREKELGNVAFRKGKFDVAARHYESADKIEPELPHYQLNLAAAQLKLNNWIEAEKACTKALSQHRSGKGYFRRARARRMLGKREDAIRDLHAALDIQPTNIEALTGLAELLPPDGSLAPGPSSSSSSSSPSRPQPIRSASSSSASSSPRSPSRLRPGPTNHDRPTTELLRQDAVVGSLPFVRLPSDDMHLRIVLEPMTVEMPVFEDEFEDMGVGVAESRSGKGKGKWPYKDRGKSGGRGGKKNEMEMEVRMREETFTYPSWERYVVRTDPPK